MPLTFHLWTGIFFVLFQHLITVCLQTTAACAMAWGVSVLAFKGGAVWRRHALRRTHWRILLLAQNNHSLSSSSSTRPAAIMRRARST